MVLVVHPVPGSGAGVRRLALDPGWRAVAPDLPGFGASDKPPEGFGFEGLTRAVAAWLQQLALQPTAVIAWGSGGEIVLAALARLGVVPLRALWVDRPPPGAHRGPGLAYVRARLSRLVRWTPRGEHETRVRLARGEGRAPVSREAAALWDRIPEPQLARGLTPAAAGARLGPPP